MQHAIDSQKKSAYGIFSAEIYSVCIFDSIDLNNMRSAKKIVAYLSTLYYSI